MVLLGILRISLLQEARKMPTKHHRQLVLGKIRSEFKAQVSADKPEHIDFLLRYGHVSLDEIKEHVRFSFCHFLQTELTLIQRKAITRNLVTGMDLY